MSRGVNVLLIFRRSLGEHRIVGHDAAEEWSILWPNGPLTNGLSTNGHFARKTSARPRFKIHHQFQISVILAPLLFCFQWDPLSSTSLLQIERCSCTTVLNYVIIPKSDHLRGCESLAPLVWMRLSCCCGGNYGCSSDCKCGNGCGGQLFHHLFSCDCY